MQDIKWQQHYDPNYIENVNGENWKSNIPEYANYGH